MNREIKFRAWHVLSEKMYYGGELDEFNTEESEIQHEDELYLGMKGDLFLANSDSMYERNTKEFLLMQYTGLNDKNGKEIYEGDIVKMLLRDGTNIDNGIIKFGLNCAFHITYFGDSGQYCFINDANSGSFSNNIEELNEYNEIDCDDLIIVGNIYENTELLKD